MPGMSGIELTRHVKERYNLEVIVFTAMKDYHDETIAAGAFEYGRKLVNLESLLKLIESIFNN